MLSFCNRSFLRKNVKIFGNFLHDRQHQRFSSLTKRSNFKQNEHNSKYRPLLKPFLFSIAFTTGSFSVAAIAQYEKIREEFAQKKRKRVYHEWKTMSFYRRMINRWNLISDRDRVFYAICSVNVLITVLWQLKRLKPWLSRHFLSKIEHGPTSNRIRCWPMLWSAFSHSSVLHLAANMFVFASFCEVLVYNLGPEQFLALYATSAVWSSFASLANKVIRDSAAASLGASGAIMGSIGFVCVQFPSLKLVLFFIPALWFYAASILKCLMAFESCAVLLNFQIFDHAAHLSGLVVGALYAKYGDESVWQKRRYLLERWHKFRGEMK